MTSTLDQRVLTVVLYGPAGSGKSTLGNTAPGKKLYLDLEGGSRWLPGKKVQWKTSVPPPEDDGSWEIVVVMVRDLADIDRVERLLISGNHAFESLIVDSLSETQALIKEERFGGEMTRNKWGELTDRTVGLCRTLRNIANDDQNPVNVSVVIATTKTTKNNETGEVTEIAPSVQGSGKEQLPFLFDLTGYLYVDEVQEIGQDGFPTGNMVEHRYFYTGRNKMFKTKARVRNFPETLVDPTISGMLDIAYSTNN